MQKIGYKIINKDNIIEITPTFRVQWEEPQQCYVILYPEGMVKLSKSAGEIMKRVDGLTSISKIISQLEHEFKVDDLSADVVNFLEVAYDNGWIRNKT